MKFINALTSFLVAFSGLAFAFLVQATPLSRRDVIAPRIITPNASTVWTIGQVETVTWWVVNELHCRRIICWWGHCIIYSRDTSNFPPDSQITNPIGQVILGYLENNRLHLDFGVFFLFFYQFRLLALLPTLPNHNAWLQWCKPIGNRVKHSYQQCAFAILNLSQVS